jgi:hypothetical protein
VTPQIFRAHEIDDVQVHRGESWMTENVAISILVHI